MSVELDLSYIIKQYQTNHRSAKQIADELNTYPNKILRMLTRAGIDIKSQSEVLKEKYDTGQKIAPMKGKSHSTESKTKIGLKLCDRYENLSDDEKKKLSEKSKKRWTDRSDETIMKMKERGIEKIQESAKIGSKLERFLFKKLKELKLPVQMHQNITENMNLEVDLLIGKVAIEIQGPTHYEPIWGAEKLEKTVQADTEKVALLLKYGYSVIHYKHLTKRKSNSYYDKVADLIVEAYKKVKSSNEFVEVEYE